MRTLYLDCISGIAGDMTLSALIDLGADPQYIIEHLRKLPIDPFQFDVVKTMKCGITAKKLQLQFPNDTNASHTTQQSHEHTHNHAHNHHHEHSHEHDHSHHHHDHEHKHHHHHDHVHSHDHAHHHEHDHPHDHHHRTAHDIMTMIQQSSLPLRVKERSISIFSVIAQAEGKIHDQDPAHVHFHEVGAMDSIIDIIGVCLALEYLEIDTILASPVPTGQGKVWMAHGLFPIPAPATAELLIGIPLAPLEANGELTTPTGAGILKALVNDFGSIPAATIEAIGYGAGEKDFEHPNVLRALLFKSELKKKNESIVVLETQVDDMTGESLGYVMDVLFKAGALDVFYTPIYMKKNRPATLITVLCTPSCIEACENVLLKETTTLGVRQSYWNRNILERRFVTLDTPYGEITVKQAISEGRVVHQAPEYEDVSKAAKEHHLPFQDIYHAVLQIQETDRAE